MFYPAEVLRWIALVSMHLSHLPKAQVQALALYSFAITVVQRSGISSVSFFLAQLLDERENSVRQRLRELLYDAADKSGQHRRDLDVVSCHAPLLRWVLAWVSADTPLTLALDATTLRQSFTVLSVSVVFHGLSVPIAWTVMPATRPAAWRPHWLNLLACLAGQVPASLAVYVLTDRGLYAKWLFERIVACGWHPLMRINTQGSAVDIASGRRFALASLPRQGQWWRGEVVCFQDERRLRATLLVLWDVDQKEAWLLLTDLPAAQVSPTWYALRMWIEAGFKALKSAGFHWQATRMTDPARAERLWLVLALATLRCATLPALPAPQPRWSCPLPIKLPRHPHPPRYPRLNALRRGLFTQLACLIRLRPVPAPCFVAPVLPPSPLLDFAQALKTYP